MEGDLRGDKARLLLSHDKLSLKTSIKKQAVAHTCGYGVVSLQKEAAVGLRTLSYLEDSIKEEAEEIVGLKSE